jgi:hypothetical protein
MNAGLEGIRPKLAKLLPLLGSNQAGEVTATAEAIGRLLKSAGLDFHDFAKLIENETPPPFILRSASPSYEDIVRPKTAPERTPTPKPAPKPKAPLHEGPIAWTFRSSENRWRRDIIIQILSIKGAPISDGERAMLDIVASDFYREPHRIPPTDLVRKLDAIRRRVLKFLDAQERA